MNHALPHPDSAAASHDDAAVDESRLWLPRGRMMTYQWIKLVGGLMMIVIFVGWMWLQWSNPAMRVLTIGLCAITAWVLMSSSIADLMRAHGRQLALEPGTLIVTTPKGDTRIALTDIAYARWCDDTESDLGLWLHPKNDMPAVQLDSGFFNSESEARTFLGWARQREKLPFEVRWPQTDAQPTIQRQAQQPAGQHESQRD